VRFSELKEKGRSLRRKKLFLRRREFVKGNHTSQLLLSRNLRRPSDRNKAEKLMSFRGNVKEK